ncbi:MAG: eukaryotic-like serine/threonine-protein kinase, partial [Actinomycetota bacterium]|nr:eukaryotic-like serine/threonine-protein kinase [Actinomycetota bacterium]
MQVSDVFYHVLLKVDSTLGGVIAVPPVVPGFITTGEVSTSTTGSEWVAVRSLDGHRFVLYVIRVADLAQAQALATQQIAMYGRIANKHLVRRHKVAGLADGTLALVLDEVTGGSLAQLLAARGQLTAGETVTTVAPLFRALADLHVATIVHGDLAPGNILFSADGRPMIAELGLARLRGLPAGRSDGTSTGGFVAPELVGGAQSSPASDVYAMAALGWFCLTGSAPEPAATRPSLTALRPEAPLGLVEVLTACLATDPAARPSAGSAAVDVFEAAPAESVALASVSDPAADVTRRIRAAAVSASAPATSGTRKRFRTPVAIGVVALLVAAAIGVGVTWFASRPVLQPTAAPSANQPQLQPAKTSAPGPSRAPKVKRARVVPAVPA